MYSLVLSYSHEPSRQFFTIHINSLVEVMKNLLPIIGALLHALNTISKVSAKRTSFYFPQIGAVRNEYNLSTEGTGL